MSKIRTIVASWKKEVLLALVAFGLFAIPAARVDAQNCNSDNNHYHSGADHCDSGGSGCTVVCG
jgi:hypothetical protein